MGGGRVCPIYYSITLGWGQPKLLQYNMVVVCVCVCIGVEAWHRRCRVVEKIRQWLRSLGRKLGVENLKKFHKKITVRGGVCYH